MSDPTIQPPGSAPAGAIPDVDYEALQPGQLIGRYEIVSVLGQGGFGITYRARDIQLGREVAIKEYLPTALAMRQDRTTVLPRSTKMAEDFGWGRERFVTEGRTLASLHRVRAIVQVFDFLEANGTAYIVMELLHGETLEERIKRQGKLGAEDIDRILWPLLDGLEQVHNAGFLHRDIKPANILLDDAGNPTLIDFGASRAAMAGRSTALTAIFTPGYAAAEQMTSAKQGPWTDIYGLSATLYHAITGHTPPSAFDRMLDDGYQPLAQLDSGRASHAACWRASMPASPWPPATGRRPSPAGGRSSACRKRPPRTKRSSSARPPRRGPMGRHVSTLPPPAAAGPSRTGLWIGVAVVLLALLGGGGYYAIASRGPDPETVKARAAAEEAEAKRLKAEEEAAKLRAENEQRQKAEQAALALKQQQDADAAAKKQLEDETRRKIENELAAQKRADEEAKRKADEEAEARRKAVDDARKAVEFVAGNFDHFGKTLMTIGLKDRPDEIRLQGVDIVNDPALHKLAVDALAAQPRNLHCRQTDRLTDGTPLYRCLVTQLNAKEPLADIPDADRIDLALALVRNGLVLASCDAPRSYADAEDDARGRKQSLWGRVTVPEYKRRCTK